MELKASAFEKSNKQRSLQIPLNPTWYTSVYMERAFLHQLKLFWNTLRNSYVNIDLILSLFSLLPITESQIIACRLKGRVHLFWRYFNIVWEKKESPGYRWIHSVPIHSCKCSFGGYYCKDTRRLGAIMRSTINKLAESAMAWIMIEIWLLLDSFFPEPCE